MQVMGADTSGALPSVELAVIIACRNEGPTIGKMVAEIRRTIPQIQIWVFDNLSTDNTASAALENGAQVIPINSGGKGFVIRSGLTLVRAEYVVLIDGDATYPVSDMPRLLALARNHQDTMVVGSRITSLQSMTLIRKIGNWIFTYLLKVRTGEKLTDALSGYRVLPRSLIDKLHLTANGFEIEVELILEVFRNGGKIIEVPVAYYAREKTTHSKLHAFRDGWSILLRIVR